MRPALGIGVAAIILEACARPEPTAPPVPVVTVTPSATPAPTQAASDTSPAATEAPPAPPPAPPRELRFVKKENGRGGSECSVVDEATGEVIARATSKNTAAGGSTVECYDHLADGKIIRFANSRGIYAKDARPGANDAQTLPCGEGAFASDVKSCVRLDVPQQMLADSRPSAPAAPFDVALCIVGGDACKTLVTIPRGRNRIGPPGKPGPVRGWDARYCADDRVLVVAEGALSLFEVPSGKLLATTPARYAIRIDGCSGGVAKLGRLVFTVERSALRPAE